MSRLIAAPAVRAGGHGHPSDGLQGHGASGSSRPRPGLATEGGALLHGQVLRYRGVFQGRIRSLCLSGVFLEYGVYLC